MNSKIVSVLCVCTLISGCATLFTGSSGPVTVNSLPSGATVSVKKTNGTIIASGMTPFSGKLKKGQDYRVEIALPGYQTAIAGFSKGGIEGWAFCNTLSIPLWAIDFLTGSLYKIEPHSINVTLREVTAQDGSSKIYAFVTVVDEDGEQISDMVELLYAEKI